MEQLAAMDFVRRGVTLRERTKLAGRLLDLFAEEIGDAGATEVAQALLDRVRWSCFDSFEQSNPDVECVVPLFFLTDQPRSGSSRSESQSSRRCRHDRLV